MTRIALWLAQHQLNSKKPALRLKALRRLRLAINDAVVSLDEKITIALLDHVLVDPEVEIRREAAGLLGDLRDVRTLPPLIRALGDAHETVQETAIQSLKKLDDKTAIAALVPKLFSADTATIQWRAGLALKSLGWQPQNEKEQIYFSIALGEIKPLARFGPAAVKPLLEFLRRGGGDKKIVAINVLGEIGDESSVKPLQGFLRDPDPLVRTAVIYAFERAGFCAAGAALIPALRDAVPKVRLAAALALGSLGDAQAVEPLIRLVEDKDWEIRRAALETLGKIGDKRAFPSVAKRLDDTDKEVREVAADALGTVGNETIVEKLVFTMVDAHAGVRQAAARALARIYPRWETSERVKKLLPEIQAAAKHYDLSVQNAAASLFQRIAGSPAEAAVFTAASSVEKSTPPAVSILRELSGSKSKEVRLVAVECIGRMKLPECSDVLKQAEKDGDEQVRLAAQAALAKLSAPENSEGQGKVTFLSKTPVVASENTSPVEEVLLCSAVGEVLHQWKIRDLAARLKVMEFVAQQAGQLARLMTLGDARQIVLFAENLCVTVALAAGGSLLIRRRDESVNGGAGDAENRATTVSAESKAAAAEWLQATPLPRGVLMRGIRFPDQTILCDVDARELTAATIEEAYLLVSDTYQWLKTNRLAVGKIVWSGQRAELHTIRRPDQTVLGALALATADDLDLPVLDQQFQAFEKLGIA
jgi:HEAT repeat protein